MRIGTIPLQHLDVSRATLPAIPGGSDFYKDLGDYGRYRRVSGTAHQAVWLALHAANSANSHNQLALIRRAIDAAFKEIDLVVIPTTTTLPKPIGDSLKVEMSDRKRKKVYDFFDPTSGCANTAPFDVFGNPALPLPCGFSRSSLLVGLMIAGPHFSEGIGPRLRLLAGDKLAQANARALARDSGSAHCRGSAASGVLDIQRTPQSASLVRRRPAYRFGPYHEPHDSFHVEDRPCVFPLPF
jgi:hypothetical protein